MIKSSCLRASIMLALCALSACEFYTPPEESGLVGGAPYPSPGDVCEVLEETAAVANYAAPFPTLIGCPAHERGAISDRQRDGATVVGRAKDWIILQVPDPGKEPEGFSPPSQSSAAKLYSGYTILYYEPQHGTQIEYYNKNGTSYLWYPDNIRVVSGDWLADTNALSRDRICHRYNTRSYNPVTGVRGGNWECSPLDRHQARIQNRIVGDIFDLSSGKIPFVFKGKGKLSIADLARQAGISPENLKDHGKP